MSAARWFVQWVGMAVVLVVLTVRVGSFEVGLPGTNAVAAFDFAGAYTRPGWRLFTFLSFAAALVVWSWLRRRKEVAP